MIKSATLATGYININGYSLGKRMKFYTTMAETVLLYGSEIWIITRGEIQSSEIRFFRKDKGCTRLDCVRNKKIFEMN